jgi:large subunit ribosomal protein L7e
MVATKAVPETLLKKAKAQEKIAAAKAAAKAD